MSHINGTTILLQDPPPFNSPYYYIPTRYAVLIYVSLFGISSALHLGQAIRFRLWWLLPTIALGCCGETVGWSGRLWSTFNIPNNTAWMIQLIATILAPTPMLAANFIMLGHIVVPLGTQYSRLAPRLYSIIFITGDIVTLVVQGVGGGVATGNSPTQAKTGGSIMLAGICLQLVILIMYSAIGLEFFLRYYYDRPLRYTLHSIDSDNLEKPRPRVSPRLKIMIGGLAFSTLCFTIRAIYRVVELAGGFHGRVVSTELYFNVLDGMMIFLASATINFVHPGLFLYHSTAQPIFADE